MDELPGRIGPYEVRDRLGQGGMGVVYLGFDPMLDRPVAIKVLKVPDEETRRRFLREARLAARVHHPHIVSIYAVGEYDGNPYLAMEFIAGQTLAQIIRGGEQVPLARKVHWLSELCAGLGHAHQSGIVHRDVKPSNLLIAQHTGTLRLVDFGIAYGNEASGMTMAGMIVGTPQYMSPEQITGQAVDARSDIFSVGAVAYELFTGRQAFGGDNLYHVSRLIVSEQPRPIESFVPDIPGPLVKLIARCLQKDPAQRAESAKLLEREFLALARRLDPEHTLVVVAPAEPTMVAPPKDLTTSRRQLLREVEEAIAQGEITTASGLLEKLEGTAPTTEVQQLRQRLQSRRLELRIQDAQSRAEGALQSGTIEEAEAAISHLADLAPRHADLDRLRGLLQTRVDERQVANLTSRARLALQQDRLEEAEALIAEALALDPDATAALAVQQKLQDRTRAQRIARLVAQASRALDQDDALSARRAVDALVKIDPSHRDVARLQARLLALTAENDEGRGSMPPAPASGAVSIAQPSARSGEVALGARSPGPGLGTGMFPRTSPTGDAGSPSASPADGLAPPLMPGGGLVRPGSDGTTAPALGATRTAAVALQTPPRGGTPAAGAAAHAAADALLIRAHPPEGSTGTRPAVVRDPQRAPEASRRRWLAPAIIAVLLLAAIGLAVSRSLLAPTAGTHTATTTAPSSASMPAGTGAAALTPVAGPVTALAAGAGPVARGPREPGSPESSPVGDTNSSAASTTPPNAGPWSLVRRESTQGRFDRAMTAIDQVQGVPGALLQEERVRVVENARRQTLAARRGAEDLRLTASPQYVLGTTRQAEADRDRTAGRLKTAVAGYMASRSHFMRAFSDSGKAAPATVVTAPIAEPPPPATPTSTTTVAEPKVDTTTWSNEEARATIAQFCGAYIGRDIGGLHRLWPNMGPEWRAEFKDAFSTSGELVCVFEDVRVFRASEEFGASARLLTQLPGGEQRRRSLSLTLVPARDRLVIGNVRVR